MTWLTRHCVAMLPLVASWSGTGTPMLTLFGRDGQLMSFSPYDSDGNYNFLICAQSGMGKSFLANALTTNFLSMGGRAWIIDKGFSYKQICEFLACSAAKWWWGSETSTRRKCCSWRVSARQ
ncbi:hypothetical protein QUF31_21390 [Dickeya chrysanthemi]|uniref:TraG/VirB4 family ATPase n=1 Tax=Dickeya chrysanthemi TaxID=556 RepID=UPI0025A00F13|nr:hypothetical protein [Dickeya chrysanthemi]WJM85515.1 hypothetical protein QUF31_21390 [Dickeya chrysanthemi]